MNSKLHMACEGLGRPLTFFLSPGQMSDAGGALALLDALPPAKALLADKGKDTDWFREAREDKGIAACITALLREAGWAVNVKHVERIAFFGASFPTCYGPEFVAKAVRDWIAAVGARSAYIEPGSPWENGYCESFDAKLQDELLNSEICYSLAEAKIVIESWCRHYNTKRPHSLLGYRPPAPEVISWPASPSGAASPATPAVAPRPVMH